MQAPLNMYISNHQKTLRKHVHNGGSVWYIPFVSRLNEHENNGRHNYCVTFVHFKQINLSKKILVIVSATNYSDTKCSVHSRLIIFRFLLSLVINHELQFDKEIAQAFTIWNSKS